jgi:uncharacterized LabA/DUF88 family protein
MPTEPALKRVVAFVDGQNLYRSAKTAFGYHYPNYDVHSLANAVCARQGWQLLQVRFYTGIPDVTDNAFWNHFWNAKFAQMGRQGVYVFWRLLRYRNEAVHLPDGSEISVLVGREKGVDVRLALDVVRLAYRQEYDVALVFSQDQDLSEVADETRLISRDQNRWLKMACAFPVSPVVPKPRGINGTDWIKIDRATYDACLDTRDYRPKPKTS